MADKTTAPAAAQAPATSKTAVRNISPGYRGLNTVQGYREFNPNEYAESVEMTAAELASAKRTGYFRFGAAAKPDPKAEAQAEIERLDNPTAAVTGGPGTGAGAGAGGGAPTTGAVGGGSTDELDKMSDDDLKTTTAALTGKPVESLPDDRAELLKLARGEA